MTDSKTQKAKYVQQSNLCDTLTEQWKKGELEEGWYYIQEQNGDIQIDYCQRIEVDRGRIVYELEWVEFEATFSRVFAPVPSYEEWLQLKELLKEVLRHELSLKEVSELTRKISQVLQEKE